ncbi:protein phosphatase 2C domain-containing protein [Streptomyces sp. 549]|uniref:protein phosphatase 2C domain-containing protein n=1 Tax=Streptomyces sp. 549 TaxID=3049076 RepID=UPI0024C303F6|nr:protein phosphatase 2C domain-containing protein [Streptomyces sp. 549]MDK1476472.1 protein phosphatase 2C domain-containing protein [Streptomyces sp. 549]
MRVEMVTEPGSPDVPNEDYVAAALPASGHGGALVALDGVTPPPGEDGCVHGVPWYTARLGGALLELSTSRRDLTLAQCLADAVSRTSAAHAPTCDLSHPRTPQATVVVARWDASSVEYLVLSDSVLLVEPVAGGVRAVLDPRLDDLLPAFRGLPRAERIAGIEALRNTAGGFHTAAADPAVAGQAVTGSLPRDQVRALLALTDGATRWTEVFAQGDWQALLATVHKEGPRALVARVRAAEAADPDGTAFPRGKVRDDASAVLVELST